MKEVIGKKRGARRRWDFRQRTQVGGNCGSQACFGSAVRLLKRVQRGRGPLQPPSGGGAYFAVMERLAGDARQLQSGVISALGTGNLSSVQSHAPAPKGASSVLPRMTMPRM